MASPMLSKLNLFGFALKNKKTELLQPLVSLAILDYFQAFSITSKQVEAAEMRAGLLNFLNES